MEAYGFDYNSLKLLHSYLSNRSQRVGIGSNLSHFLDIIRGLPQGSILGPILFNISINDLMLVIQETQACNFADDTTIYAYEKDTGRETEWFKLNSMVANPDKFQLMFLKVKPNSTCLVIATTCIYVTNVNKVKLL